VAFLALPVMVSASEETVIPPEVNWTPIPPASETRVVSTEQEQASDIPRAVAVPASDENATYRLVNATLHDD
jgi:hypothetical protein